jgi:hypothetical protein
MNNILFDRIFKVNGHIHTPYSFSSFESIKQAFRLASTERIQVLGINDFYVTDGYSEFSELSEKYHIYPLFNIELISLLKDYQKAGITVNDPNNPGRVYISGKGLSVPFTLNEEYRKLLDNIILESQQQVKEMVIKINSLLNKLHAGLNLSFDKIKKEFARELVRERHIAKALRIELEKKFKDEIKLKKFLKNLYSGVECKVVTTNHAAFENEIRSNLLKAGGSAFVQETDDAFIETTKAIKLIRMARGIPTYPVLLDDKNGNFTIFESDKVQLLEKLSKMGIYSVEFIPNRNSLDKLREYTLYFYHNNFLVTYGTEHNTPDMIPLTPTSRDAILDDRELLGIVSNSTAVIAAHQHLKAKGIRGYLDEDGQADYKNMKDYIELGAYTIYNYINNKTTNL